MTTAIDSSVLVIEGFVTYHDKISVYRGALREWQHPVAGHWQE